MPCKITGEKAVSTLSLTYTYIHTLSQYEKFSNAEACTLIRLRSQWGIGLMVFVLLFNRVLAFGIGAIQSIWIGSLSVFVLLEKAILSKIHSKLTNYGVEIMVELILCEAHTNRICLWNFELFQWIGTLENSRCAEQKKHDGLVFIFNTRAFC